MTRQVYSTHSSSPMQCLAFFWNLTSYSPTQCHACILLEVNLPLPDVHVRHVSISPRNEAQGFYCTVECISRQTLIRDKPFFVLYCVTWCLWERIRLWPSQPLTPAAQLYFCSAATAGGNFYIDRECSAEENFVTSSKCFQQLYSCVHWLGQVILAGAIIISFRAACQWMTSYL